MTLHLGSRGVRVSQVHFQIHMAAEYYLNPLNGSDVIAITKVLHSCTHGHELSLYPLFSMRGIISIDGCFMMCVCRPQTDSIWTHPSIMFVYLLNTVQMYNHVLMVGFMKCVCGPQCMDTLFHNVYM